MPGKERAFIWLKQVETFKMYFEAYTYRTMLHHTIYGSLLYVRGSLTTLSRVHLHTYL